MVIIIILMQRDYGPMYQAEKRARLTGKLYEDTARPMMSKELDAMNVAEGAPLRMCNAIVPILTFIIVTLLAIWYTGGGLKEPLSIAGIQNAFGNSDSASSILYAVIFTSVVSIGMAAAQRIMSLKECIEVWLGGCKRAFADCYDSDPGLVLRFRHGRSGNRRFHLWYGGKFHTWSHLAGSAVPGILLRRFFHGYFLWNDSNYDSDCLSSCHGRHWGAVDSWLLQLLRQLLAGRYSEITARRFLIPRLCLLWVRPQI